MQEIVLNDWSEFDAKLRAAMKHRKLAIVRNFNISTVDPNGNEIDLIDRVRKTGTDRGTDANMWNAPGFDYDHDALPAGKAPNEIFYASRVDLESSPTKVLTPDGLGGGEYKVIDVTKGQNGGPEGDLGASDAIVVYDPRKVEHKTVNEYWFKGPPLEAALFLFRLRD